MNQNPKIFLIVIGILLLGFGAFVFLKKYSPQPTPTSNSIIDTENPTTTNSNLKTYRNEEWGFEFEYPAELSIKEKVFGGYYSQFNLVLFKHIGESRDWAVIINIVLPEFVDTTFWKSQESTSKVVVDGVVGTRYEYEFEGFPHTSVILPLREFNILLGTGEGSYVYSDELNQILSSFRFLKNE